MSWAGAVARNHQGLVVLSIGKSFSTSNSVEEAEARAALVGLQPLATVFRGPVELELDCKWVTDELTAKKPLRSSCFGVLQDIKVALEVFASHKVSFVRRGCNTLAHELAAVTRQSGDFQIIAGVPESLRTLMILGM